MTPQDFENRFNKKVAEAIKGIIFPAENIPDGFRDYLTCSIPVFTYHAVKCTLDEFETVAEWATTGGEISMIHAFIALQITRGVTAKDISVNLMTYIGMNRLLDDMALAWDVIAKPFKEQANIEVNKEYEDDLRKSNINSKTPKIHLGR